MPERRHLQLTAKLLQLHLPARLHRLQLPDTAFPLLLQPMRPERLLPATRQRPVSVQLLPELHRRQVSDARQPLRPVTVPQRRPLHTNTHRLLVRVPPGLYRPQLRHQNRPVRLQSVRQRPLSADARFTTTVD